MKLLGLCFLSGCCTFSSPGWHGPPTKNFDGAQFQNQTPVEQRGPLSLFQWLWSRERGPWPDTFLEVPPGPPPVPRVAMGELRVTFINHATVLVQMDGLNILTDPVWSDGVGPPGFELQERIRPPGVRFEDLPKIDLVLISHNHYDHLDMPTLRKLYQRDRPKIAAGLGTAALLKQAGITHAKDLDWWQSARVNRFTRVTSVPVQHFSMRGLCDRNTTLWSGFVVSGPAGRVYFAGDTGMGPHFAQVGEAFGPIRLALLPIGAFRPRWFMHPVHIDPKDAVVAHQSLRATTSVGIHYGTFQMADDGFEEPAQTLIKERAAAGLGEEDFWILKEGEGKNVPPTKRIAAPLGRTERWKSGRCYDAVPG